jgi:serine/threonine protein kinase/TolB-like protein/Tfp pilus assembly protein PilF
MRIPAEQLSALSSLLDEAMDLPDQSRELWLRDLSEPFPGATEVLRKMLRADRSAESEGLLDTLLKVALIDEVPKSDADTAFEPNAQVGNYRLERLLGRGGMGSVWLARRTDELVNRPVALKLPHLHLQGALFAERFARERDILANLTHPNIAHLYDAGISAAGQPYLAMEYVAGESITQYCVSHGLGTEDRLALFLQVLSAVQYAHVHNVIHRDLKPSNILVREGGQVVLLDFGIAKLLVEGETGESAVTRHGGAVLTPDYASPEQISDETLGAATDIYSLGVVLYELLCGQRPYALTLRTRRTLEQAILSTDPRPPSEVVSSQTGTTEATTASLRLRRALQGDLDTIVLKALKKRPGERYAAASDFAEDLRRLLRGEAISARPDSLAYRTKKWALRHKPALQSMAITIVVIAVVLAGFGAWWRRAAGPGAPAATGAAASAPTPRSVAVLPFVDMSEGKGQEYFADGMTDQLINELAQLSNIRVSARTSSFYFKGRQSTVAEIAKKLSVADVVEGSVRRVGDQMRITVQLIDAASEFQLWSHVYDRDMRDVLDVESSVATSIAQALNVTLSPDDSARFSAGETKNPSAYEAYLRAEQQLAKGHDSEASTRDALRLFDQAIALDAGFAQAYAGRARSLATLAVFHVDAASRDEVRRQALAAGERAVALAPQLGEVHATLAITRAYGLLDFVGAAPEFDRALALSPGNARVQRLYAEFSSSLGHHPQALAAARRAVSLDPQNVASHMTLGRALHNARDYQNALIEFRDALALQPESTFISGNIAGTLIASGQLSEARAYCESTSSAIDAENRHYCLALAYHRLGAQSTAEHELEQLKALAGDEAAFAYAEIYAEWGETRQALAWLATADRQRDPSLQSLRVDYLLDSLRDYPDFHVIEDHLRLPP